MVPWDQPTGSLRSHRLEIKHKTRGRESRVYLRYRESSGTERASERLRKKRESHLCLGSGVFTGDCVGCVHPLRHLGTG